MPLDIVATYPECPVRPDKDGHVRTNCLTRMGSLFLDPRVVVKFDGDQYGTSTNNLAEISLALAWQAGVTISKCKKGALGGREATALYRAEDGSWKEVEFAPDEYLGV